MRGQALNADFRFVWPDLSEHWLEIHGKTYRDPIGNVAFVTGTAMDVERRRHGEDVLVNQKQYLEGEVHVTRQALESTKEQLQALNASLFTAQEEERRRVARELHDDLSQRLAILEMDAEQLRQQLAHAPEIQSTLRRVCDQAASLSEDLHRIAHQLHPSMLDDFGLPIALRTLVEEMGAREGRPVRFASRNLPSAIPPVIAVGLYRVSQEALRNISKYAGKARVHIYLIASRQALGLSIRDYGAGFNIAEAQQRHGLGLISMEERIRLLGGSLRIESGPGRGTRLSIRVPLPPLMD